MVIMTMEEIDARLAELEAEKEKLLNAKKVAKNKRFEELSEEVMTALWALIQEFPHCEWVVEVDTMGGLECIDLLNRSDMLTENHFSQD